MEPTRGLMAAQVRTEGERIANLEGQIAHLATKGGY